MEFSFLHNNTRHAIRLDPNPDGTYTAHLGERTYIVEVERAHGGHFNFLMDGHRVHAHTAIDKSPHTQSQWHYVALVDREVRSYRLTRVEEATTSTRGSRSAGGGLTAQMPGQVMRVLVAEGGSVKEGQPLILLEAMKMEIQVASPHDGTVTRLMVQAGDTVERGQLLAKVSPAEH